MVQRPKVRTVLALATLSAFGLVAAACGGGDGGSSSGTTQGTSAPTVGASEAPSGSTGAGTEAPTTAAAATPTPGGSLVFGLEADTSSPWRPAEMVCATSCYQVIGSVYDPLTVITDDGGWKPYLAESVMPNADNTVWTIKVRPGITFHDGTPLDGAAVVENLTRAKNGFLTGTALADVTNIAVNPSDPLAADVTIKRPWTDVPVVPGRPDRDDRLAHVAQGERQRRRAEGEARRHRPVHLRELRAQRVVQGQAEPQLLEQALPVPRRDRVPSHRRRPQPPGRAEERRRADHPHDERADHRRRPRAARTSCSTSAPTRARPATPCCTSRRSCRTGRTRR